MLYNALDKFDKDVVSPTILEDYNRVDSFNRSDYDSSLKLIRDVNSINNIKRLYEEYRKNMKLDDSENSRSNDALDKDADILFAKLVHSVRSIESSAEQKLTKEDKKKERESERLLKEANAIFDDLNALSKNYKSIHGADLKNCPYITSCYSLSEVIENLLNNDKLELLDRRLKELRTKEGSLTPKEVDELNILSSRKELLGICVTSILKSEDLNFDANDKNISIFDMIGFVPEHLKESVVKALYKRNNPLIKKGMKEVNDYLNQICDRKKSLDACKIHIDVYIDFAISELTKDKKEKLFEKLLEKMNSKLIQGCSGVGYSDSVFNALIKKLPLDYLLKMSQKDDTLLYPNIKGSTNYIMNDKEKKKDMKEKMVNGKMSYQIEAIIKDIGELRILIASNRDYERHPMLREVGRGLKEINDGLINRQRLRYGYIDKSYLYTLHNSIAELANRYAIAAIRINDGLSKDRAKDLFASLKDAVNDLSEIKYKAGDTMSELEKAPANNSLEGLAESMDEKIKTRSTIEGGGGRDLSNKALNAHSDDGDNQKSNDDNCNRENGATFANEELIEALPEERDASMIEGFVPKEVDDIPKNLSESELDTKSRIDPKSIILGIEEDPKKEDDEKQSESIKDTSNDRSKKNEKENGGPLSIIAEENPADYYPSMILPQDQENKPLRENELIEGKKIISHDLDNSIASEPKLSENDNKESKVIKNEASASHAPIDNGPVVNPVAADSRVAFRFTKALESALGAQGLNIFGLDNNRNTNNSFKSAAYAILSCAAVWRYNPTMQYRIIPALISNFVIEFFNLWAQKLAQKGHSKTALLPFAVPVAFLIYSIVCLPMPLLAGIILVPMISQLLAYLADLIDRYYNKNEYGGLVPLFLLILSPILKMLSMIVSVASLQLISSIGRGLIPSLLPMVLKNWLQEISIVLIFVPAVYSILKGNTWKSLILTTLKIVALIGVIFLATCYLNLGGVLAYIPTAISVISNIRANDKKDYLYLVIACVFAAAVSLLLVTSFGLSIPMAVMTSAAFVFKALERITNYREMGGENKGKYFSLFVLDIITTAMSMYISSYFAKLATHNIVGGSMSGGYVERDMAEYNSGFKLPVKSGAYQNSHADIIPSVFNALSISRGTKNDFFKALSSSGSKPLPIVSIAPNSLMMIIALIQCASSSIEAYISKKLANDKKPAPTQVP